MVGYAHARKSERARLDLSFLAGGLRFPWVTMVFITGFAIEAMLAVRLWLQMTNANTASGLGGALLSITDVLVAPFRSYEPAAITERASGIFEFSTLVAVEAYLIGTLAIVLLIVATRFVIFTVTSSIAAKRRHDVKKKAALATRRRAASAPAATNTPTSEVTR